MLQDSLLEHLEVLLCPAGAYAGVRLGAIGSIDGRRFDWTNHTTDHGLNRWLQACVGSLDKRWESRSTQLIFSEGLVLAVDAGDDGATKAIFCEMVFQRATKASER